MSNEMKRDELARLREKLRNPRTITTTEELRALKPGTRLLGRNYKVGCGRLWRVEKFGVVDIESPLGGICGFRYFIDPLPAVVLTEPDAAA